MRELALFAGAGGGLLGSKLLGWRTVCAVEIDPYCVCRLMQRQNDGVLEPFPIWDDVRSFDGAAWRGCVDVVSAGFPCQPFSVAGRRMGEGDGRNMWPDTIRIIREVRPRFVFLENVPGLGSGPKADVFWHTVERFLFGRIRVRHEARMRLPAYLGRVFGDLAASGYDARWDCIPASACGAPHQRDRLWIVAHVQCADSRTGTAGIEGCEGLGRGGSANGRALPDPDGAGEADVLHPELPGAERFEQVGGNGRAETEEPGQADPGWWDRDPADGDPAAESYVGRVADGVAHRVDRLRCIGNGQVPEVVATAWRLLTADLKVE